MAKLEIELSEFDALRDAKNKAEDDLKELKQSHKEEISDLKNTIKDLEKRARVIIKHENKYFYKSKIDNNLLDEVKDSLIYKLSYGSNNIDMSMSYNMHNFIYMIRNYDNYSLSSIIDTFANTFAEVLNDSLVEATEKVIPLFSEHSEPDQYIGFDDIKLDVEKELKDQYINNQKKIKEKLEQQIQDYENKYKNVDAELQTKYDERIKSLEGKLNSSQEETNKLKESHKGEVDKLKEDIDKLKEELKEAQKTQEEKILEAEEKLKEAQEVLKKLTNNPRKKWYQFWK